MSIVRSPATDPRMAANILESLRLMKPADLERFGEMHKSDPYMFSLAFNESNIRKKVGANAQMQSAQQPPVNEQALQGMRADASVATPEDSGIAQLNTGDMNYADGGIVAFAGGGKSVAAPSFDDALDAEGVTDPTQRAFLKSLYAQESSSGKKATTSNRGAVGGMQILPGTFKEVADPGMDIRNPLDNMRAGIRYGMKGYQAAKGDPVLAGAHYYGGPGGLQALAAGAARKDPVNPTAPDTRQYGESIAKRMTALLPIGSAQAAQPAAVPAKAAPEDDGTVYDPMSGLPMYQGLPRESETPSWAALKDVLRPVGKGVVKAAKFITSAPDTTADVAPAAPPPMAKETFRKLEREPSAPPTPIAPEQKKELTAAAKATMTPEERKESGFTSDDWLTLGFSLLSSKSPQFMEALGSAGLATLAGKQAREKTGLEAAKTRQDIEGSKALARKYGAEAQTLEAETKTDSAQRMKAATLAQGELEKWAGLPQNFNATPAQVNAKRDELMRYYFQVLGQSGTIGGAGGKTGNPLVDKYLQ